MSFIETPRFPENISAGATGGPEYKTDIVMLDSGFEQRNLRWDQARNKYQIDLPLVAEQRAEMIAWFRSVKGRGHGFRLKDWSDYQATVATGRLGTGDEAIGAATYQLTKLYTTGAYTEYREIKKPVDGSVSIYRGGVLVPAADYTLDTTTGIVTFDADSGSTINASGIIVGATTEITIAGSPGALAPGDQVYLSGFSGADSAVINGLPHLIDSIGAGSPRSIIILTDTTGLAITVGIGTIASYAQTGEALTWAGEFDVPVRFDGDYLALVHETPNVYRAQSVDLIEVRTP